LFRGVSPKVPVVWFGNPGVLAVCVFSGRKDAKVITASAQLAVTKAMKRIVIATEVNMIAAPRLCCGKGLCQKRVLLFPCLICLAGVEIPANQPITRADDYARVMLPFTEPLLDFFVVRRLFNTVPVFDGRFFLARHYWDNKPA